MTGPSESLQTDHTKSSSSDSQVSSMSPANVPRANPYTILNSYTPEDGPFILILCVNSSLGMSKGKVAAQCSHAALGAYKTALEYCQTGLSAWESQGQAKVVAKADNESDMHDLLSKATSMGLVACLFVDDGRTQVAPGSKTVLAIGPAPASAFEGLTSHLKLM